MDASDRSRIARQMGICRDSQPGDHPMFATYYRDIGLLWDELVVAERERDDMRAALERLRGALTEIAANRGSRSVVARVTAHAIRARGEGT